MSDFTAVEEGKDAMLRQEFVAIDRFTGGVADKLKFNAEGAYRPMLRGTLSLNLARVSRSHQPQQDNAYMHTDPWTIGLMALVIRDLIEGDIPLGFGASKGYGASTARIHALRVSGLDAVADSPFAGLLANGGLQATLKTVDVTTPPPDDLQQLLAELIAEFHKEVAPGREANDH